jgi:hypothetical protein
MADGSQNVGGAPYGGAGPSEANKGAAADSAAVYNTDPYAGVHDNQALLSAVAAHSAEVEHQGAIGQAPLGERSPTQDTPGRDR